MVRHSPEEYGTQDWRRFSSSFVTPPDTRKGQEPRSTTLESSWQDDKGLSLGFAWLVTPHMRSKVKQCQSICQSSITQTSKYMQRSQFIVSQCMLASFSGLGTRLSACVSENDWSGSYCLHFHQCLTEGLWVVPLPGQQLKLFVWANETGHSHQYTSTTFHSPWSHKKVHEVSYQTPPVLVVIILIRLSEGSSCGRNE